MSNREVMEYDVVIVGAGPAGLSTAIKLKQLSAENNKEISVCVIEKGSEVGAHILSGAVIETKALDELIPDWQSKNCPLKTKAKSDKFLYLTEQNSFQLPTPPQMHNEGNYIISLGDFCKWLADQAEALEVEIYPGFSASEILFDKAEKVLGVATCDMGRLKDGSEGPNFEQGIELRAKQTVFSEGCRGHLGKELITKFNLDAEASPQHYGLGFKEIWDIAPEKHQEGLVVHTAGWPLDKDTTGGGYLYHAENNQVFVGLIVDLNYSNPHLSPFDEFQRYKHHPKISQYLEGGKRVSYGARALAKGGFNSLPKMTMPGAILVGCDAGTLNFAKIKGNHTAMKSGMLAAETICEALMSETDLKDGAKDLTDYAKKYKDSWLFDELYNTRNFGPAIHKFGTIIGGGYNTIDQNLFAGKLPFNFKDDTLDHAQMKLASEVAVINYPKHDNKLSFDKLTSVFLSNTNHEEEQPCHLKLTDVTIPIAVNLVKYGEPARLYCPAGVYEVETSEKGDKFVINAQNCIHCKTCDIKDPSQNITWVTPEGTGGPNYPNM